MECFSWNKRFETGLDEVDRQHKMLVDIINRLSEAKEKDVEEETSWLDELLDYAQYHFREEELLMHQIGIDSRHIDSHIEAHKAFIEKIMAICFSVGSSDKEINKDLLDFLVHWLGYHILVTDQNMAYQIEAVQSGIDAKEAYAEYESEISRAVEPLLIVLNNLFQKLSKDNIELKEKLAKQEAALLKHNIQID